jgi:hypothetical protein
MRMRQTIFSLSSFSNIIFISKNLMMKIKHNLCVNNKKKQFLLPLSVDVEYRIVIWNIGFFSSFNFFYFILANIS